MIRMMSLFAIGNRDIDNKIDMKFNTINVLTVNRNETIVNLMSNSSSISLYQLRQDVVNLTNISELTTVQMIIPSSYIHYIDDNKSIGSIQASSSANNVGDGITSLTTTITKLSHGGIDTSDKITPTGDGIGSIGEVLNSWPKGFVVLLLLFLIVITVIGNTLVIISVVTTRRLRTVTNCFVMSLAVADWLVGLFVMPPAVMLYIVGSWQVGWILCDIWISLDILLCTASILSLCAISLDRYLAVTQPLHYKKRRSKRLALFMIFIVWVAAIAITCPPYMGWYEPGRRNAESVECRYNQNKGYVIFSAMGSFFIPMIVMLYVYSKIFYVLISRHHSIAKTEASERSTNDIENDFISDFESHSHSLSPSRRSVKSNHCHQQHRHNHHHHHHHHHHHLQIPSRSHSHSQASSCEPESSNPTLYELVEISKSTSTIKSSTITCKISSNNFLKPIQQVHFCESQSSISESCQSTSKLKVHTNGNRMPIRISSKRETKTAQTLSMVVGGFILCWLPFFICYLITPFLPKGVISEELMIFLTWLGWINSAINPFIYAFYNADFRLAFWRITFRKFCKAKHHLTFIK